MNKLAFVDIETTGCSTNGDRIIEIGVLRVEDGNVVQTFQSLINPEAYISPFITSITGISAKDIENAPLFASIADDLKSILSDCIFVAHNVKFDYGFLKSEFKRYGYTFHAKQLCTAKLSRRLFPEQKHHNLDSIMQRFGLECESRHRAFDDAKVMFDFFQKIKNQIAEDVFEKAIHYVMKKPSLPAAISQELISELPEKPGVYIFLDEQKQPLYVGKSINIKDRVLSHFSDSTSKELKIATHICEIQTLTTHGELGALLLESHLIKKLQPLYNRKLRNAYKLIVLKKEKTEDGYFCIKTETLTDISPDDLEDIMGIFRSERDSKTFLHGLSEYYYLCHKFVGLEKTNAACFQHKLGICKGACIGKENPLKYNLRFTEAFTKTLIKQWPFNGAIIIREANEEGLETGHIINQWCYVGKMTSSDESIEREKEEIIFDYDSYKIIERYIRNEKNRKNIMALENVISKQYSYSQIWQM